MRLSSTSSGTAFSAKTVGQAPWYGEGVSGGNAEHLLSIGSDAKPSGAWQTEPVRRMLFWWRVRLNERQCAVVRACERGSQTVRVQSVVLCRQLPNTYEAPVCQGPKEVRRKIKGLPLLGFTLRRSRLV
jgi:hypothetical protein